MTSLTQRAAFYRTLSQLLAAGAAVPLAMESALAHLPARRRGPVRQTLQAALARGAPISAALAECGQFPSDHVKLLSLAERSGHADLLLRDLADFTDDLIALRRTVLGGFALPAFYLVVAALVAPLPSLVMGGSLARYLFSSLGFLALVGFGVGGTIIAFQRASGATLDRFLRPLPLLGSTWRELELWQVARTLALLARTSTGVIAAVRFAAEACRSPRLAGALQTAAERAEAQGSPLSPLLHASGEFSPEWIALWQTGELTGGLDDSFQRLATLYAERCRHRLKQVAQWAPRIAYFLVAAYMVYEIFRLAGAYLGALDQVTRDL